MNGLPRRVFMKRISVLFRPGGFSGANFFEVIIMDEKYMELAVSLALKGLGRVSPNPAVGAVIVKNGRVIGGGYHEKYGGKHAEINALESCIESPDGSDMYVTLEPCGHFGKQPPCAESIIKAGIKRVFVGCADPNPLVAGRGITELKKNGVKVETGVLENKCRMANEWFFHYIKTKTPFTVMKYAMTMDGKICSYIGESKWITGEEARKHVHSQRGIFDAVMVGVGTVISDNPLLTCRTGGRNPIRIICDTNLRTPLDCSISETASYIPSIIATCRGDLKKTERYVKKGFEIITVPEEKGRVGLKSLMRILGERGIGSVIIEGGAELNWSALESGVVQKIQAYISPKILGGKTAKTPIGGVGFPHLDCSVRLSGSTVTKFGGDFLIESGVSYVHGDC